MMLPVEPNGGGYVLPPSQTMRILSPTENSRMWRCLEQRPLGLVVI